MALTQSEIDYLGERFTDYRVTSEANMQCIVLPSYTLPTGYAPSRSDLLIRLNPGYPDVPPDMWWFDPAVRPINHPVPPQTECTEQHLGRQWQRWSRHLNPGQWKSGIDSLESFFALLRLELERWVPSSTR